METNDQAEAQQEVEALDTEVEALEAETDEVQDTTNWKAKHDEIVGRLKRAETKLDKLKIDRKAEEKAEVLVKQKTGELDETQLDYLDLKGISESEDIKVLEGIMQKTGMTVRQALKDDYVIKKLEYNKAQREVKEATPSSTRRSSGGGGNDLSLAIAKYEQSGYKELPSDFALRSAVVNAIADRMNPNKPTWRRN